MSHLDKLYNCIKIIISSTQRIACERKWRFFGRREIGADRRAIHAHGYRWFNHPNRQRQPPSQWNRLVHRNSTSIGTHPCQGEAPKDVGMHYGTKPGHFETSKIHFPTSEGVSERANERRDERAQYCSSWLFWPTVQACLAMPTSFGASP